MDIYVLVHQCLGKSNGAVNTTFLLLVSKQLVEVVVLHCCCIPDYHEVFPCTS